jgi:riboflavin synthase
MFAGIVRAVGRIAAITDHGDDRQFTIHWPAMPGFEVGASIAVNGVCLTATRRTQDSFVADVSMATLAVTTLGQLHQGAAVNLEPSLRLGDAIDGHLVYGHVDGVGEVVDIATEARSLRLRLGVPASLDRFLVAKGSVAVDGVSLTVNGADYSGIIINIVPHTRDRTIISAYAAGTPVNIEIDMLARYLERLREGPRSTLTIDKLRQHGFAGNDN